MLNPTEAFCDPVGGAQQGASPQAGPGAVPIDAWREGKHFVVEFDLPGIAGDSLDFHVEGNVLTVRAQRLPLLPGTTMLVSERPRGTFSHQLALSGNLDTQKLVAIYTDGVLRLRIPLAQNHSASDTADLQPLAEVVSVVQASDCWVCGGALLQNSDMCANRYCYGHVTAKP